MTTIYTITGIPADYGTYTVHKDEAKVSFPKTFGWWPTLADAEDIIHRNTVGCFVECLFTYLVIEEKPAGYETLATERGWYRWEGETPDNPLAGRWVACERPAFAQGICNWAF